MRFEKELLIGLLITVIAIFLSILYLYDYNSKQINRSSSSTSVQKPKLTMEEVSKHNLPQDCWIVVNSKVLAVSKYLEVHPGGEVTITDFCGMDATQAYDSIEGGNGHSQKATLLFSDFLIGLIGQDLLPAN